MRARVARWSPALQTLGAWFFYCAVAYACTKYLNSRARLVPKWGEWYMASEGQPYVLLQVRAFLSGHLALFPHPTAAINDSLWGRGGMHTNWGLGVPLLATPFYIVGRLFGAPGFPDNAFFLILYAIVTVLLAHALHKAAPPGPNALVAGAASAGFVMVFPTLIGHAAARFLIYDQTILVGAVWDVLLLAGVLAVLHRPTPLRVAAVCAAAGFSTMIRIPLAIYGLTTAALALFIAHRRGAGRKALLLGLLAYAGVTCLYLAGNWARFGSPLATGYENTLSGAFPNRGTRWGTPFLKVPFLTAAKELYATLFLLDPVPTQIMMGAPPEAVRPYAIGERWREYYSPTFSKVVVALWAVAACVVVYRIVRRRLWRRDRDLRGEVATIVGAWALPPSILLFVFYARVVAIITRYATDMYPAFAAACLCAGIAAVDLLRARAPSRVPSLQLAIAGAVVLEFSGWRGWATGLSHPVDRKAILAVLADVDAHKNDSPVAPDHLKCNEPRGPAPVHSHLADWWGDCTFSSGMVFALKHSACLTFTFAGNRGPWTDADEQALAAFRVNADFDPMVRCGPASVSGDERRLTVCDPKRPPFLLDGMRLYAVATLDKDLTPIDRLRLLTVEPAPRCR